MCYKKPGPRCSIHAKKRLVSAKRSGDTRRIKEAIAEYNLTPAGIQDLKAAGKIQEAQLMKQRRSDMIRAYKEDKEIMDIIKSQMVELEGDEYHGITLRQIEVYKKKYGTPEVGRTRAVFDRGDGYVIKVPLNGEGYMASNTEKRYSEMDDPYIPVAKCWYEDDYSVTKEGFGVLVMEKVKITRADYKNMPDWVMAVDCGQVGYNKAGELVAYDV